MSRNVQKAYRQGDVLLLCVKEVPSGLDSQSAAPLAYGEVTGHKHQFTEGRVRYFLDPRTQVRFLAVDSPFALLTHEEHGAVRLPRGAYQVRIQREYEPDGWRNVAD